MIMAVNMALDQHVWCFGNVPLREGLTQAENAERVISSACTLEDTR